MSSLAQREQIIALLSKAMAMGARQDRACAAICLSERTLQRWQRDSPGGDQRALRVQAPKNQLSVLERERLVRVANSEQFGHLPPGQIVPRLADQGIYIASESTFNRILKAAHQFTHRGAERPPHKRRKPRALYATQPDELFS
jgi:putative transposase